MREEEVTFWRSWRYTVYSVISLVSLLPPAQNKAVITHLRRPVTTVIRVTHIVLFLGGKTLNLIFRDGDVATAAHAPNILYIYDYGYIRATAPSELS